MSSLLILMKIVAVVKSRQFDRCVTCITKMHLYVVGTQKGVRLIITLGIDII